MSRCGAAAPPCGLGLSPFERRLAIVAAANFAAFAGFFLGNNTHNGFIFGSLTLVPVVLAVLVRDSWILLALLLVLSLPDSIRNVREIVRDDPVAKSCAQRANYLAQLARTLPDDPWHTCDVMQLICMGRPRRSGQFLPCAQSARCAAQSGGADAGGGASSGAHDDREPGATISPGSGPNPS